MEPSPSVPQFSRRKQNTKKRKSRSTFGHAASSIDSAAAATTEDEKPFVSLKTATKNEKKQTLSSSLSLPPLPTQPSQSKLRAPPTVPGYDEPAPQPEASAVNKHATIAERYSTPSSNPLTSNLSKKTAFSVTGHDKRAPQSDVHGSARPVSVAEKYAAASSSNPVIPSTNSSETVPFSISRANNQKGRKKAPMLSRQADPFSEEWGRGFDDDQPSFLLASVDDDAIQPSRKMNRQTDEAKDRDGAHDDSEDNEWHEQLLRRAGVNVSDAARKTNDEAFRRDEHVIRDELAGFNQMDEQLDMDSENATDIANALSVLQDLTIALSADCKQAQTIEQKEREQSVILRHSVAEAEARITSFEQELRRDHETKQFYLEFQSDLNTLSNALRRKRDEMLQIRQVRIDQLQEKAEANELLFEKGEDEFGRVRRPGQRLNEGATATVSSQAGDGLNSADNCIDHADNSVNSHVIDIEENESGIVHPLADLNDSLKDPLKLLDRFNEWERKFSTDFKEALGDFSCGRMVGAVATCERSLSWIISLNTLQRVEACKVCDVIEEMCWTLRAKWKPTDASSCHMFGKLLRSFYIAFSSPDKDYDVEQRLRLNEAIKHRVMIEKNAAMKIEDNQWIASIRIGASTLCRLIDQKDLVDSLISDWIL